MNKELKEFRKITYEENDNINKEIEIIKERFCILKVK